MMLDHFMEAMAQHGYLLQQRTELVTQQIPSTLKSGFTLKPIYNQNLDPFPSSQCSKSIFMSNFMLWGAQDIFLLFPKLKLLKEPKTNNNVRLCRSP